MIYGQNPSKESRPVQTDADGRVEPDRAALEEGLWGGDNVPPARKDGVDVGVERPVEDDALSTVLVVMEHEDHGAPEDVVPQPWRRHEQSTAEELPHHSASLAPGRRFSEDARLLWPDDYSDPMATATR